MTELNDFIVSISGGSRRVINGENYVVMTGDETEYSINLKNGRNVKCDVVVKIDDENIGTFRLNANQEWKIERPSDQQRKFTFFVGGSKGSQSVGYIKGKESNGVIHVTFKPEQKHYTSPLYMNYMERDDELELYSSTAGATNLLSRGVTVERSTAVAAASATNTSNGRFASAYHSRGSFQEGVTGLGAYSDQKFKNTTALNYSGEEVVIIVRLVVEEVQPKYIPLNNKKSTLYPRSVQV